MVLQAVRDLRGTVPVKAKGRKDWAKGERGVLREASADLGKFSGG